MSLSILMVGNSLTAANAMPSMLASLLDAQVVAITRGALDSQSSLTLSPRRDRVFCKRWRAMVRRKSMDALTT